eukprot:TRINITY_DN1396_c0_g1_i17.p1 TRINITY_DN1396_c0_g1~~TRINITY_DN1396_c0_g1_i17.p1  ORF type:complete len:107 (+),score=0.25 TRINITY_DN1396_c0_g1_i17:214-534(+)
MTINPNADWLKLCNKSDLVPNTGVAALYQDQQIAIFYIPGYEDEVFAIGNQDPFSGANILARGLIGDIKGCLLYTSDAADEEDSVDLGGRRIIKKKKKKIKQQEIL